MTLATLATVVAFPAGGALWILFKIAILCVVVWAIRAFIAWAGYTVPRPIEILVIALFCILLIYWIFELVEAFL